MIVLSKEIKVSASYLTKRYELHKNKAEKAKASFKSNQKKAAEFWALRGVSFEVKAGEAIGLIGTNGSGKSTLLKVIAGMLEPTTGNITINGKTSIIAIGSGLKRELTGRENIKLKGLLSGFSNKEINQITEDIISFADLGNFIDQPIKNYSSGMKSRLGFAISVHNNPDILIIDEALSVGDATFYQRCVDKIMEFKAQGKTIFFVSHSLAQVNNLCDKVIWMDRGELRQFGPAEEVIDAYRAHISWYRALPKQEQRQYIAKRSKERQEFSLDQYYQNTIKQLESNDQSAYNLTNEALHRTFYGHQLPDRMSISSKIFIIFILIILFYIMLSYVPNNSFSEVISRFLN